MGDRTEPSRPHDPGEPHLIHQRHRDIRAQLRFILTTLRKQNGTGLFIAYGHAGEKRLRRLNAKLPLKYRGVLLGADPDSPLPTSRDKYARYQRALLIRPADQVPTDIHPENPQAELLARYGEQLTAERRRLRAEHPGWDQDTIGPDEPPEPPGRPPSSA